MNKMPMFHPLKGHRLHWSLHGVIMKA